MINQEYWRHTNTLLHSFKQLYPNDDRLQNPKKSNTFDILAKIYIYLFGIPEIGFTIRNFYFEKIIQRFLNNKNPKTILDAGTGIGAYALWLAKLFPNSRVTGCDLDHYKLKVGKDMKTELLINNVNFIKQDIINFTSHKPFDIITCIDVLEHVNNYRKALMKFRSLLRKNGYLYIHVPQPHQQRLFPVLRSWHHNDHKIEGIAKKILIKELQSMNFRIITAQETFGAFGKLTWELNHILIQKNLILAGLLFPLLKLIAKLDLLSINQFGLGIAVLAQKK